MRKRVGFLMLTLLGIGSLVAAQAECGAIVQRAVDVMDLDCAEIDRNQACYGNGAIEVEPQTGAMLGEFDSAGDMISVIDIQSMSLSEFNEALNEWGVALLSVQANLPDTLPGQNVTMLIFGDTEVENAGEAMEAFYFSSGVGTSDCNEAPNGILIQSPEDTENEIELTINDVGITLASTAFITAQPDDKMTFSLLEGEATLAVGANMVTLAADEFSTVELDDELRAISAPTEPEPIEGNLQLSQLPLQALPLDLDIELSDADSGSTAGHIIPRNGDWTYTATSVETSSGCPAGFANMMQTSMGISQTMFVDFGGESFDFETWFMANTEGAFSAGQISSPEANVYQASMTIEGTEIVFDMHIVSETRIEGSTFLDMSATGMACELTIFFEVTLDE